MSREMVTYVDGLPCAQFLAPDWTDYGSCELFLEKAPPAQRMILVDVAPKVVRSIIKTGVNQNGELVAWEIGKTSLNTCLEVTGRSMMMTTIQVTAAVSVNGKPCLFQNFALEPPANAAGMSGSSWSQTQPGLLRNGAEQSQALDVRSFVHARDSQMTERTVRKEI